MKLPTLLLMLCLCCPALAQQEDDDRPLSAPLKGNVSKTDLGGAAANDQHRGRPKNGSASLDQLPGAANKLQGASDQLQGSADQLQGPADQLRGAADQDDQQAPRFQRSANHGEAAVGVICYTFDNDTGKILTIYPGSDLPKHGVKVGDRLVSVDGHAYDPNNPRAEPDFSIGAPGTIVHMVFKHNGRPYAADIERRDSRFFVGNPSSDGYFEWAAAQTRRW